MTVATVSTRSPGAREDPGWEDQAEDDGGDADTAADGVFVPQPGGEEHSKPDHAPDSAFGEDVSGDEPGA